MRLAVWHWRRCSPPTEWCGMDVAAMVGLTGIVLVGSDLLAEPGVPVNYRRPARQRCRRLGVRVVGPEGLWRDGTAPWGSVESRLASRRGEAGAPE